MATLEDLTAAIAESPSVEDAVTLLLGDLARRIKATSNDQNIQRLARDLTSHAPALVEAIARKPAVLPTTA